LEAWRLRRNAYSSGRKETIGFTKDMKNPFKKATIQKKERFYKKDAGLKFTPFRGAFRSRRY